MRRLGIFGGTFNPIHNGHLHIAAAMQQVCDLDRLLFIPAATPPHKRLDQDVSYAHRAAMVELAIASLSDAEVSDIEARRSGKSFSVDTLRELRERCPGSEMFFLIGMDSFRDLASWRDYRQLFTLAHLVVAARPGVDCRELDALLPVAVRGEFCYDDSTRVLRHRAGKRIVLLSAAPVDISSSMIRARLAAGATVGQLVPASVRDYITRHRLYRTVGTQEGL